MSQTMTKSARDPWTSPKPRIGFSPEGIKSCKPGWSSERQDCCRVPVGCSRRPSVVSNSFQGPVVARLPVAEEVDVDWARGAWADDFKVPARQFEAQQGTSK